ncbi:hypothetical protein [Tsuneonella mangrovi]|uniref:hypothetical protein n=1 Tax=Tsuneonella mangrovi TaxID=1982042 RepID=UPI000BA23CB1|nr:hypothetical protein [Tsuneonella mangrovi]
MAVLLTWDVDPTMRLGVAFNYIEFAMAGSFLIGLPVAIGIFFGFRELPDFRFPHLLLLANFIAALLIFIIVGMSGAFGAVFLGVPILFAANVFAIAGWFMVFRPYQMKHVD